MGAVYDFGADNTSQSIGDILFTTRDPGENYILCDGRAVPRDSFLFADLPLINPPLVDDAWIRIGASSSVNDKAYCGLVYQNGYIYAIRRTGSTEYSFTTNGIISVERYAGAEHDNTYSVDTGLSSSGYINDFKYLNGYFVILFTVSSNLYMAYGESLSSMTIRDLSITLANDSYGQAMILYDENTAKYYLTYFTTVAVSGSGSGIGKVNRTHFNVFESTSLSGSWTEDNAFNTGSIIKTPHMLQSAQNGFGLIIAVEYSTTSTTHNWQFFNYRYSTKTVFQSNYGGGTGTGISSYDTGMVFADDTYLYAYSYIGSSDGCVLYYDDGITTTFGDTIPKYTDFGGRKFGRIWYNTTNSKFYGYLQGHTISESISMESAGSYLITRLENFIIGTSSFYATDYTLNDIYFPYPSLTNSIIDNAGIRIFFYAITTGQSSTNIGANIMYVGKTIPNIETGPLYAAYIKAYSSY